MEEVTANIVYKVAWWISSIPSFQGVCKVDEVCLWTADGADLSVVEEHTK